jgi:hypothetical protein
MKRNAAFGIFVPDLLKAQSGGHDDIQRRILISVRKQYFNESQYWRGVINAIFVGLATATFVFIASSSLYPSEAPLSFAAGFALGFWALFVRNTYFAPRWNSHCNPKNKDVPYDLKGMVCIESSDCTVTTGPVADPEHLCVHDTPPEEVLAASVFLRVAALIIAIGLTIAAYQSDMGWNSTLASAGAFTGAGCGVLIGYLMS